MGLAHKEELASGIPDQAFKKMPEDDKDIRAELAKRNKREIKERRQIHFNFEDALKGSLKNILQLFDRFNRLPENSIDEIQDKRREYNKMTSGSNWMRLKTLADIQVAQFFIPKNALNVSKIVTYEEYMDYLSGTKAVHPMKAGKAGGVAAEKRFFHYFLEFPEIFAQEGFDCILGNPPYLGGRNLTVNYGFRYSNFLKTNYPSCTGNTDLVAFFLMRAYSILDEKSFMSFICTKSIYQGDTRIACLEELIKHKKATINFGVRSVRWPGKAMVVVCLLSVSRKDFVLQKMLDGKKISHINSFLENSTMTFNPFRLNSNKGICFKGSEPAIGFMISKNEAKELIDKSKINREVIYPYLNGDDLNSEVTQLPTRYVINFFDWSIEKAQKYKGPFNIVKQRVKTIWDEKKDSCNTSNWWWHRRRSEKLYHGLYNFDRAICVGFTSKYAKFSFAPVNIIYSNSVVVVCRQDAKYFAILNSSFHEYWSWKNCSTMGDSTLRYTPSSAFSTYPFPDLSHFDLQLEQFGNSYSKLRSRIMAELSIGLTKVYNLFNSKKLSVEDIVNKSKQCEEQCKETYINILSLRELHKNMDQTVLKSYGWEDLDLAHDFYEVDYLPENDRIRYTITPAARKEVLKRLLKLNHAIHDRELKEGLSSKRKTGRKRTDKHFKPGASQQIKIC
ncbi:hypothetical protein QUF75_18570 [Desulfococcaceae bacterium HSG7]|nr:hypothetical protein [Desulfococcaceae bacterium HSG7]